MSLTVNDRARENQVAPAAPPPPPAASVTQQRAAGSAVQPQAPAGDGAQIAAEGQASANAASPVNFGAWGGGQKPQLALEPGQLLSRGSRGDKVRQLQEMLNKRGAQLDVDGVMGNDTARAVRDFQKQSGLDVDGVVGQDTLGALNASPEGQPARKPEAQAPAGPNRFAHTRAGLDGLPAGLRRYADAFQRAGEKYGVDPRFLAAISMQETGGGTSSAIRNRNNAMGIMGRSGVRRFSSVEASIEHMARGLARPDGYYAGKNTIREIARTYAPVGAANDPRGLNRHWPGNVSRFYEQLGGDASQRVVFR